MKKNIKRITSFIMAVTLTVLMTFYQIADAPKVYAFEIASDTAVVVGIAATCLVAGGVAFASTGQLDAAAKAMSTQYATDIAAVANTAKFVWNSAKQAFGLQCAITDVLWNDAKNYVKSNYKIGANSSAATITTTGSLVSGATYNAAQVSSMSFSDYFFDAMNTTISFGTAGQLTVSHMYDDTNKLWSTTTILYTGSAANLYFVPAFDSNTGTLSIFDSSAKTNKIYQDNFYNSTLQIVGATSLVATGETGYAIDNPNYDWTNSATGTRSIDVPLTKDTSGSEAGIVYNGNTYVGDVQTTEQTLVGDTPASIPADGTLADDVPISIPTDITSNPDITTPWPSDQNPVTPPDDPDLRGLILEKFPFCLPWDLYNVVKLLAANPEPPDWKIDFLVPLKSKIPFVGSTQIDINMANYSQVGLVIRWTTLIGFCLFLILITRMIIRS